MIDWKTYRNRVGGLTWRAALESDIVAIDELLEEKDRHLRRMGILAAGKSSPRPSVMNFPTLIALVAEDEDGVIVDGLFLEAVVDMTKMTLREETFESIWDGLSDDLAAWLKSRHFGVVNVVIPKTFETRMDYGLLKMKFKPSLGRFFHWFRRL